MFIARLVAFWRQLEARDENLDRLMESLPNDKFATFFAHIWACYLHMHLFVPTKATLGLASRYFGAAANVIALVVAWKES